MKFINLSIFLTAIFVVFSNSAKAEEPYLDVKLFPFSIQNYGIVDSHEKLIVPLSYQWIGDFVDGRAAAIQNNKYGVIDFSGKVIVPFQFDNLGPWSENRIRISIEGLYGFSDWKGAVIVKPIYEDVGIFSEGRAWVRKKQLFGFIDSSGNGIISPQFEKTEDFHEGLAAVFIDKKWGFVDPKGQWVIKPQYDEVERFGDGVACVWNDPNSDYDIIDHQGKKIFSVPFDPESGLPVFQKGVIKKFKYDAGTKETDWVFYDKTGKIIRKEKFDSKTVAEESGVPSSAWSPVSIKDQPDIWKRKDALGPYFVVTSRPKWGYIDVSGKVRIEAKFDDAKDFQEGVAVVTHDNDFVWLNSEGQEILRKPVSMYGDHVFLDSGYHEGILRFMNRGKLLDAGGGGAAPEYDDTYGAMDKNGNIVLERVFGEVGIPDEGLIYTEKKRKIEKNFISGPYDGAYYDLKGNKVFDVKRHSWGFSEGLASIYNSFVDKKGRVVFTGDFNCTNKFSEDLASVWIKQPGTMASGFIDLKGHWAIAPKFQLANAFSEGLAAVMTHDQLWGYIDKTGAFIIEPRFAWANAFHDKLAKVRDYPSIGHWGYINPSGKWIIPPVYDYRSGDFKDGLALLQRNLMAVYVDQSGNPIFSFVRTEPEDETTKLFWP